MSLYRKSSGEYIPPPTPFGGFIDGVPAVSGPHLLVSGPSGVGKSRRVLAPAALMWQGPVVAVSSKPDLIDLCLTQRLAWGGTGRTYVLDLSGEVPDAVLPEGVQKVTIDPTALIVDDDFALDMASTLMKAGSAGASSSASGDGGDPFWENIATAPLAAILRAAGVDGIAWARTAVGTLVGTDEDDTEAPCWANAVGRLEGFSPMLAAELESAAALDAKMRDSVMITMKSALAPWWRSTVAGRAGEVPFTPAMLEHPRATLFIVAPATGVAAGAAVATVDAIATRWRAGQTEPVAPPALLMVVDELCNTMPWAKLPTVITEARAMGISVLAAVQATSQFARRYGGDGMTELRDVWPSILCLVGAPEKEILEKAAWAHGQSEHHKVSTDHRGQQSQSSERTDTFHATDLLPRSMDEGRLLRGSKPDDRASRVREAGLLVSLVDISQIQFTTTAKTA